MSKQIDKEGVIAHKKKAIKRINDTFEKMINDGNPAHLKKANTLSYWLENYSEYIDAEEHFDYTKIPKYNRGDVISLNFGFNVGSEHGGLHFAVVLNNDNIKSSKVITVVPLSSGDEEKVHPRDVYLGNELHDKISAKSERLREKIVHEESEIIELESFIDFVKSTGINADEVKKIDDLYQKKVSALKSEKLILENYQKEIQKLKAGSIALMEQITTVSKMRIYKPLNADDILANIKFSSGAMEKINNRLKELYIQ